MAKTKRRDVMAEVKALRETNARLKFANAPVTVDDLHQRVSEGRPLVNVFKERPYLKWRGEQYAYGDEVPVQEGEPLSTKYFSLPPCFIPPPVMFASPG